MDGVLVVIISIIGIVLLAIYLFTPNAEYFCKQCHVVGQAQYKHAFGAGVEWFVYLIAIMCMAFISWLFIFAALLVSIIRLSTKQQVCGSCKSVDIIPTDSPAALEYSKPTDLIDCPYCAEPIKKTAILCKHCSKDLPQQASS